MRKFLSLILMLTLVLTVVACADNVSYGGDEDEKTESQNYDEGYDEDYEEGYDEESSSSPKTIMDLFDGERRVWYYTGTREPAHDDKVYRIVVTENKQVVEMYYTLGTSYTVQGGIDSGVEPNPFSCEPYLLSEFDGMSDDEVLELVRKNYADASESYEITVEEHIGGQRPTVRNCKFKESKMPYDIEYSGKLDKSGNNLEYEIIRIFEKENFEGLGHGSFDGIEFNNYTAGHPIIYPTKVKSKEFVGLTYMITRNTYKEFKNITFDEVSGMADWDYNYYRY